VGGEIKTSLHKKYNFTKARQRELFHQLLSLFQPDSTHGDNNNNNDNAIACAVPTIHFPRRLASAYLNPTSTFMNTLMMIHNSNDNKNYFTASSLVSLLKSTSQFLHVGTEGNYGNNKHPTIPTTFLLTAGKNSHGFAPKKTQCSTRTKNTSWVPEAYQQIYSQLHARYNQNGSLLLLLFNRENWTFHSKGIWLSAGYEKQIEPTDINVDIAQPRLQQTLDQSHIWYPQNLRVVIVGSGKS